MVRYVTIKNHVVLKTAKLLINVPVRVSKFLMFEQIIIRNHLVLKQ